MNYKTVAKTDYDVIVIGGGPAGMMAAGKAAENGAKVALLEKNSKLGKKLLITGGGRCNLTNAELDTRTLLSHYKDSAKFLFSTFSQFGVSETLDFFHTRGLATKVEDNKRVFPMTDKAESVFNILIDYLKAKQVKLITNSPVTNIEAHAGKITALKLSDGTHLTATNYILATGGKSRPETGSTGDGFRFLKELGHTVTEPDPSLVPIALKETWVRTLAGVALSDVKITVYQGDKKHAVKTGRMLFTHVGVSGPMILNLSKLVGELLDYGPVVLSLDLFPDKDHGTIDTELVSLFHTESNKQFKNVLTTFFPQSLANVIVSISGIPGERPCHSISKESRRKLTHLLKDLPLSADHLLGTDKAIVTSGGVSLSEVDTRTMCSKKIPNLYLVGDVLNIDRPSGGYSLQLCWTTGYVAGNHTSTFPKTGT